MKCSCEELGKAKFAIEVKTDSTPTSMFWEIIDLSTNNKVLVGGPYQTSYHVYREEVCMDTALHKLIIYDQSQGLWPGSYYRVELNDVVIEEIVGAYQQVNNDQVEFKVCMYDGDCQCETDTKRCIISGLTRPPTYAPTPAPTGKPTNSQITTSCLGSDQGSFSLELKTDTTPSAMTWEIWDLSTNVKVLVGGPYQNPKTVYIKEACLDTSLHKLIIYDQSQGLFPGSYYKVAVNDKLIEHIVGK